MVMEENTDFFRSLASSIAIGFRKGSTSLKDLGVDHAMAIRIFRSMKADSYEGSAALYVCQKLFMEIGKDVYKENEDVLWCILIGSITQSKVNAETLRKMVLQVCQ